MAKSTVKDYAKAFDSFDAEVGDAVNDDDQAEIDWSQDAEKREKKKKENANTVPAYMLFDFRRGSAEWPMNVKYVDIQEGDALLQLALQEAENQKG